jgi:hypothetical protein
VRNLEANPDVAVQFGSEVYRAKAIITEPAERDRLFEKIRSVRGLSPGEDYGGGGPAGM